MDAEIVETLALGFLISVAIAVFMCTVMNWKFWENLRDAKWITKQKEILRSMREEEHDDYDDGDAQRQRQQAQVPQD